ncbi:MAG: DUF3796 domain-containing protein [Blautia sp.]|jgi:hypothetical protein
MKKNRVKWVVGIGVFCILALVASSWYSVAWNDSRLVAPMDFGSYVFEMKDLPMILSIVAFSIYVLGLFVLLFLAIIRRSREAGEAKVTRSLNPKLGYLGFLGFLGFSGFWTYQVNESVFPFMFFLFFGFFGFYYEGKMSGTFMDERFRENAVRAQLNALKITTTIIMIAMVVLCQGKLFGKLDYTLIAVLILLSLALALGIFLNEYLLYRYDNDDQYDESEE